MWRGPWFALFICAVGCGSGTVSTGSSESFLTALPSRKTLEVTAPTREAPAALAQRSGAFVGETASLYVLTRQMTGQVNGFVRRARHASGPSPAPSCRGRTRLRRLGTLTDALSPWRVD
jgi:hypothetical protein